MPIRPIRSKHNPIIYPNLDDRIERNINGPALIRVPDWVSNPLGQYYLYFAHHQGKFIRLAYANNVLGPYTVHTQGVLQISDTSFEKHIASPDVHIDHAAEKIRMYYHGAGFTGPKPEDLKQVTCYAESDDGLNFVTDHVGLGTSYMRIFQWDGWYYGFGGGSSRQLWRTKNNRELFERGPKLPIENENYTDTADFAPGADTIYRTRHPALHLRDHELDIYYSNVGDTPERIKRTTVDLRSDWTEWRGSAPEEILRTENTYEGLDLPSEPSTGGSSHIRVHQVRDPYLYIENDCKYLVYSVAGETGLGIAELIDD
jgi:hypothetical protein